MSIETLVQVASLEVLLREYVAALEHLLAAVDSSRVERLARHATRGSPIDMKLLHAWVAKLESVIDNVRMWTRDAGLCRVTARIVYCSIASSVKKVPVFPQVFCWMFFLLRVFTALR